MNNTIHRIGNLGRDPEQRTTSAGKDVTSFSIGVKRAYKGSDGVDTDWFNCTAFGQAGIYLFNHAKKGDTVHVIGSHESRTYEKEGEKKTIWEVKVREASIITRRNRDAESATEEDVDPFAMD